MKPCHRHPIRLALLWAFLWGFPLATMQAQSAGQAGSEPLELRVQGQNPKIMMPGSRLALYGPENTKPIKGRLVTAGDTIILFQKKKAVDVKVPAAEVTIVRRYRVGFMVLAVYMGYQMLMRGIGLALLLSNDSFSGYNIIFIAIAIPGILLLGGLLWLFAWLGSRKYPTKRWKIVITDK